MRLVAVTQVRMSSGCVRRGRSFSFARSPRRERRVSASRPLVIAEIDDILVRCARGRYLDRDDAPASGKRQLRYFVCVDRWARVRPKDLADPSRVRAIQRDGVERSRDVYLIHTLLGDAVDQQTARSICKARAVLDQLASSVAYQVQGGAPLELQVETFLRANEQKGIELFPCECHAAMRNMVMDASVDQTVI